MAKKKIAILGGGVAGLTAAYELTQTEQLRAENDVTVYQMGWRLGGKAASGRDELGRNREHGLHVWFGCYENVFRMTREIYRQWNAPVGCPLKGVEDVAKPQLYTPIGVEHNGEFVYFPLQWPLHTGVPGDGQDVTLTPRDILRAMSQMFIEVVRDTAAEHLKLRLNASILDTWTAQLPHALPLPPLFAQLVGASGLGEDERTRGTSLWQRSQTTPLSFGQQAEAAYLLTTALLTRGPDVGTDAVEQMSELYRRALAQFTPVAAAAPSMSSFGPAAVPIDLKFRLVWELVGIFGAMARGYFLDLIWPDAPFEALDDMDLREWLKRHGAPAEIVDTSSVLRIVYDTLFQFADGDVKKPSYAAGTALGVIGRLIITYKSAMMYEIQAGMGEALIAPLYEVLRARGVSFKFFHKVRKLALAADKRAIDAIMLKQQARVTRGEYRPVAQQGALVVWPHEPFWDQLEGGNELRDAGVDFENHWADAPGVAEVVLRRGADFDVVVLAISMGAYKRLNAEDGSLCDELIDRAGPFASFVNGIDIVPTQSLQLWCDKTLDEMGWTSGKAATVSGPEYLNIWADMSQVIGFENQDAATKPKSLHYLCGTLATDAYKQPASARDMPRRMHDRVRTEQIAWLNDRAQALWPAARKAGGFDFGILNDPNGRAGEARFDAQHFRANVSPTECCVLSAAGTTKFRLQAHESGFDNLILAGEATRHGFNTTAIEGAVMSGMAASQAICGSPAAIPGHDFLRRRPSERETAGDGARPATPLRRYTSWVGHGGMSFAAPARFTDAKAFMFLVNADVRAMQRMADQFLNANTDGTIRYQVAPLSPVLVTFMDVQQCTSVVDSIGWTPGRETAFWIPLLETKRGRLLPRPVLWAPYIFIDYMIGMLTGREIWGWSKTLAEIGIGVNPGANPSLTCSTMTFDTLAPATQGRVRTLYSIAGDTAFVAQSALPAQGIAALAQAANAFTAAARRFLGSSGMPNIAAVALKQVRDSRDADSACYQAIVDSPVQVTRLRGGGVLSGNFRLTLNPYASHPIARDLFGQGLGAAPVTLAVQCAAWANFDFDAMPGDVVFQSGAA